MKKSLTLISVGILNLLHASSHIIQFIQSVLLVSTSVAHNHKDEGALEHILHNPVLNIIWALVGLFTLYIGIKDFRHHNKCTH
jgi:hypothetical protein